MKNSNCESPLMDAYCQEVRKLEGRFRGLELHHIRQKQNLDADALTKMVAERKPAPNGVFVNDLNVPSAHERQPAVDNAKTEEIERAQKTEHAPSDLAPDQTPGGPTCLATEQSDPSQTDNTD
jgi:hypothetical protein